MSWYSILGSSNCRLPLFSAAVFRRFLPYGYPRLSRDLLSTNTVYTCIESNEPIERNFFIFRATATFLLLKDKYYFEANDKYKPVSITYFRMNFNFQSCGTSNCLIRRNGICNFITAMSPQNYFLLRKEILLFLRSQSSNLFGKFV